MMMPRQISLGSLAERRLAQLGLSQADLAQARWGPGANVPGREYERKYGTLQDGRRVLLSIQHDRPEHVVKFRVLQEDEDDSP